MELPKFPYLTFKSKRIEVIDSNHGRIVGDLTIRDVSREVTLEVEYNGKVKSPFGHTSAGFSASTTINRKDWGLQWNVPLETGGWLVGETVQINIEFEMIEEKQAETVA